MERGLCCPRSAPHYILGGPGSPGEASQACSWGGEIFRDVPGSLHIAVTVASPLPRARQFLTTETGLEKWLARSASFDPEVGRGYRVELLEGGEVIEGSVQGYDPAFGIAFSFADDAVRRAYGSTVARWSWEALSPDYTLLTLIHSGYGQGDVWQQAYERHLDRWTFYLRNLVSVAAGGKDQRLTRTLP